MILAALMATSGVSATASAQSAEAPAHVPTAMEVEVAAVETAFAKTMADRDFEAFKSFLDPETVFWSGGQALRGKDAVAEGWKGLYEREAAPFSWKPETVMVLDSGTLAHSTGPVTAPDGRIFAYFHSTWRKNADGEWKIIFDKGQRYCPPPEAQ
ncbi:MAG: nuclear transport factor 2 family protein [Alphaproteobacteria bacterium]|nr:nuclear transport factor 2 family protein [Alphaproteobacteria bacterium]